MSSLEWSDDLDGDVPEFEAPARPSQDNRSPSAESWANDDMDFLSDTDVGQQYDDEDEHSSYDLDYNYKRKYVVDEDEDTVVSPRTNTTKKLPPLPPKSHPKQQKKPERARGWTRGDLESSRSNSHSRTNSMMAEDEAPPLQQQPKQQPKQQQQQQQGQEAAPAVAPAVASKPPQGVGNLSLDAWSAEPEPEEKPKSTQRKKTVKSPRGKGGKSPRRGTEVTQTPGGGLQGWLYKQKAAGRFDLKDKLSGELFQLFDEMINAIFNTFKGWKSRYCVYDPRKQRLVYYHYEGEKNHANFISLDSETRISILEGVSPSGVDGFGFQIDTSYTHRPYVFCTDTQKALDTWMVGLERAVVKLMSDDTAEVDLERVLRSYETSRTNTARNYPVVDLVIECAEVSQPGEYFAACYATGDQKFRTWAVASSKAPEWSCDGTFMNKQLDISTIKVKMFSRSKVSGDRCVGKTEIDISGFQDLQVVDQWFELQSRKRGLQSKVRIRIQRCTALAPESINASWGVPTTVLPLRVDSGDIILFGNSNFVAQGTKMFTRSQWDHVAIVLRWQNNELKLFEATGSGVGLYKLGPRLEVLHSDTKMAIRRLVVSERTREMIGSLHTFIEAMRGRHYKKRLGVIVKAAVSDQKQAKEQDEEDLSSVFCSELVVAAFQRMDLVSDKFSAKGFLPKDLADKNNESMPLEGASLERKRIFSKKKDRHMDKVEKK